MRPTAMLVLVPTRAGKEARFAAARTPPFPRLALSRAFEKGKTNWESFGRREKRDAAVSARKSCWVRDRVDVGAVEVDMVLAVVVTVLVLGLGWESSSMGKAETALKARIAVEMTVYFIMIVR